MTKIDESEQYKFSEIIAMLENKELPAGTAIQRENKIYGAKVLKVESNVVGEVGLISMFEKESIAVAVTLLDINSFWSIKLPKEDKFYLKAPKLFARGLYLNYNKQTHAYFLGSLTQTEGHRNRFTKKEISAMTFDTTFFGEPIKVEQDDE